MIVVILILLAWMTVALIFTSERLDEEKERGRTLRKQLDKRN